MTEFSNIIINTDNYKHCHYPLYPPGTEYVSSYIESRGGEFPVNMFVGLQAFIREFLMHPITLEDIDEAEYTEREQGMHFNRENWMGILNDHGGYLPVEIEAVPEGTVLPIKNVLLQVINTDPKYWWATSFFETALLRAVWYPTTIGTISWLSKQVIKESLAQTSDHPESLRFILHDYGARGVSSQESAALGGLAHLVNFDQSDTVPGIIAAKKYYNAVDPSNSGPNAEHAGFCAWGRENEASAMLNMLDKMEPDGCALLLTDTYDHEYAVKNIIGDELKERIEKFQGLVGIRPDSGDVVEVTSSTTEWLMDAFGYTTNSKGYKVLPDFVRTVQGDGVRRETLPLVFMEMERRGLATDNAVFGMGSGLLQHCNRDTMKLSKKGRLALKYSDGDYTTVKRDEIAPEDNQLVPVFRNGQLLKKWDFAELKERSEREVPEHYYADYVAPLREAAKGGATPVGA